MKCPECLKEGKQSYVYPGNSITTLMDWQSYYDKEGNYHSNNPNKSTTSFRCSEGHEWNETY